jgi:predicted acyltransferase
MEQSKTRLYSVDVFRGITVAAMILVNNPGSWGAVFPPLLHAPWHGCTPTDLIFPFFLFIMGFSVHLAYQKKKSAGLTGKLARKLAQRAVVIFALGLLLSLFPKFDFTTVRIPGVLQRISLVFLACGFAYFLITAVQQVRLIALLLVGYYLLLTIVPLPDGTAPNLEKETNLAAWIDRLLLNGHLWAQSKTWDPEGVLSTLPAIATGLLGMVAGQFFDAARSVERQTIFLFIAGSVLTVAGLAWSLAFPINKSLWTSSYVLYTAGLAMLCFGFFHWLIEGLQWRAWSAPFQWYGVNAIFVFVASGLIAKIMLRIRWTTGETSYTLWSWLYQNLYASWLPPATASLGFALSLVAGFGLLLRWMFHKNWILKV